MDKKKHSYTIQERIVNDKPVPFLTISGQWLAEQGFTPHTKVELTVKKDGSLLLKKQEEA